MGIHRLLAHQPQAIGLHVLFIDVAAPDLRLAHIHQLGEHLIGVVVDQARHPMARREGEAADGAAHLHLLLLDAEEAETEAIGELDHIAHSPCDCLASRIEIALEEQDRVGAAARGEHEHCSFFCRGVVVRIHAGTFRPVVETPAH